MKLLEPPPYSPSTLAAIARANSTLVAIASVISPVEGDQLTVALFLFSSQALEHFQAILQLTESRRTPGSALALFRPLAETIVRAQWLRTCATEQDLKAFFNDPNFSFPGFRTMARKIAEKNELGDFFDGLIAAYGTMCDYTHSGYQQVANRLTEERTIGPNYPEGMIRNLVIESEKLALFHFMFFCRAIGDDEGALALSDVARTIPERDPTTAPRS